ncbi:hypothetical protein [Streptomyces boluensis]|uniref:Uncharacterized protein n=1 Tax=Streptomyces boluensis TaxID=1775135 RepID=A0A964UNL9_9ACTN|nr:hypothetical protein [Streptomyces boluensis]NBE51942.1 hypothetical protein [Streptomyces boluensis]
MTGHLDDRGDDHEGLTPGEEVADQERSYWDNRRLIQELDDTEEGRRERRRLKLEERKMHLRYRMHRYQRQQDQGPLPGDMVLPSTPDREYVHDDDLMDPDDRRDQP